MTELAKRSSKPKLIRASRLVGPLLEEERGGRIAGENAAAEKAWS